MIKKELNFEYVEDFVEEILDKIYDDEDLVISIVAKFDEMKEILKTVILLEECVDFEKIDLTAPIISGYEDEYVMDIFFDGNGVFFDIQPAKYGDHYVDISNDEIYVLDNCRNKVLDKCRSYDTYVIHIDDEDNYDAETDKGSTDVKTTDCAECDCLKCKSKNELSDKNTTKYYVNDKAVSKKEYDVAYSGFRDEFKQMLKRHCEFMDEVNNIFARLW